MKGFPLLLHIFIQNYPVYFTDKKSPSATSIYLSVSTSDPGTKPEISRVMQQVLPYSKNTIGQLRAFSKIFSRTFYVGIHTCHIRVYLQGLNVICTLVRMFIYSSLSIHTGFCIFLVPVNSLFRISRFRIICNPMIPRSTSKARICILIVTFSTFVFRDT